MSIHPQVKKSLKGYLISIVVLSAVYSVLCTPLNLILTSDILMMQTVWPLLLDLVMSVLNFLFFWVSFAYLIHGIVRTGLKTSAPLLVSYACLSVGRYLLSMLASFVILGFPEGDVFFSLYFSELVFYVIMDLLQAALAVLILWKLTKKSGSWEELMPAAKIFDKHNAVQLSALLVSAIPAAVSLLSRLFYDINYGAPASGQDLVWMVVYYLSDLLSLLAGYLVMLLLLNRFALKEE